VDAPDWLPTAVAVALLLLACAWGWRYRPRRRRRRPALSWDDHLAAQGWTPTTGRPWDDGPGEAFDPAALRVRGPVRAARTDGEGGIVGEG
jgi:hypothetical protein